MTHLREALFAVSDYAEEHFVGVVITWLAVLGIASGALPFLLAMLLFAGAAATL